MIALITPTGARYKQLEICKLRMLRQTYTSSVLWVIVDDCMPKTAYIIPDNFKNDWEVVKIYPEPAWQVGQNTQSRNLLAAVTVLESRQDIDYVFIIEDDDYYTPIYLSWMMSKFSSYDMIGQKNTLYYHVEKQMFRTNGNNKHASLFQTAFSIKALPLFKEVLQKNKKFIDIELWKAVKNSFLFSQNISIGIKGMKGREGIGKGHQDTFYSEDKPYPELKAILKAIYK